MNLGRHLIVYKNIEKAKLFSDMTTVIDAVLTEGDKLDASAYEDKLYECLHQLTKDADSHGFCGNLWHSYLTFLLVNDENAYSLACEIRGAVGGSINDLVMNDLTQIRELFQFDMARLGHIFKVPCIEAFMDYEGTFGNSKIFNPRIRDRIEKLCGELEAAASVEDFKEALTEFYGDFGVGNLGLHKAFRVQHDGTDTRIVPIGNIAHVKLDDLIGYDGAKKKLIDNTEAFVAGREANNCLLFGDAGTGKSTSIKAIANQYYDRGLRLIEIYKHQFAALNDVIGQVKNRNYKFIIYMDDLSFEEFETEYKYLKAVIEGGLEKKPENVLIYATSNRRHLIRENFSDKEEIREDMHTSDTVQEKLSLYARFGVTIYFGSPSKKEFNNIVLGLAEKNAIDADADWLIAEANKWELSHGGLSGRTAQQFIDYILGTCVSRS